MKDQIGCVASLSFQHKMKNGGTYKEHSVGVSLLAQSTSKIKFIKCLKCCRMKCNSKLCTHISAASCVSPIDKTQGNTNLTLVGSQLHMGDIQQIKLDIQKIRRLSSTYDQGSIKGKLHILNQ